MVKAELYGCQSCPDCRRVHSMLGDRVIYIDISKMSPEELTNSGIKTIPSIKKEGNIYNVKSWGRAQLLNLIG